VQALDKVGEFGIGQIGGFAQAVVLEHAKELSAVVKQTRLAELPSCHAACSWAVASRWFTMVVFASASASR